MALKHKRKRNFNVREDIADEEGFSIARTGKQHNKRGRILNVTESNKPHKSVLRNKELRHLSNAKRVLG